MPTASESTTPAPTSVELPVDEADDKQVAPTGRRRGRCATVDGIDGRDYRVLTRPSAGAVALQLGRDLSRDEPRARRLRDQSVVVGCGRRRGLPRSPVGLLAQAVDPRRCASSPSRPSRCRRPGGSTSTCPPRGRDEAGRLGGRLHDDARRALAASRTQQQRLVQDAGHELRTPLTSLRTNVDVLRRHETCRRHDRVKRARRSRRRGRASCRRWSKSSSRVGDRRDSDEPSQHVALGRRRCGAQPSASQRRTGRRHHGRRPTDRWSIAQPAQLERAISNLLDNAAKFDRQRSADRGHARSRSRRCRDHGPGIAAADLPHVFDRFFRSVDARSEPGSGPRVVDRHRGRSAHGGDDVRREPSRRAGPSSASSCHQ